MGRCWVDLAGVHAGARAPGRGCGKGAVDPPRPARLAGEGGHFTRIDRAGPMLKHARAAARQARVRSVTFQPGDAEDPARSGRAPLT